jgi:hypothetical protein
MTYWVRLAIDLRCGRCGRLVAAQQPVQVIRVASMTRHLFRGQCCAGVAPVELPVPQAMTPRPPLPFTRTRELVATLPPDWKSRAAREPGEEG